jgi:hypothetical protein
MSRVILLVSHQLDYSGAPLALFSLAKALTFLGASVKLRSFYDGPLRRDFEQHGIEVLRSLTATLLQRTSVIVANTLLSIPPAVEIAKEETDVIGWVHESLEFLPLLKRHPDHQPGLNPDQLALEKLALAIFPSHFQLDQFMPYLGNTKGTVLQNLVEQPFRARADQCNYDFSVCGDWNARKGQSEMVRHVDDLRPGTRIAAIGAVEPTGYPSSRLNIHFLGPLLPSDARRTLAESRVFLSNSSAETSNLAAIEALMAGRTAVLSDIPAHRYLTTLTPLAILFQLNSRDSLSSALARAESECLNEQKIQASIASINAVFGWEQYVRNVRAIFDGFLVP